MDEASAPSATSASTSPASRPEPKTSDAATEPAIIVIFGITGDLAQRKLIPALYHLVRDGLLDPRTVIVGVTRRAVSTPDMLNKLEASIRAADGGDCNPEALRRLQAALRMRTMNLTESADYAQLKLLLESIETEQGICMDRLYYLSIPPQMFGPIVRNLGAEGLNASCGHGTAATRLLIEKPFGYDLASARELLNETGCYFQEDQLFRVDHYVAKDPVQNILAFRSAVPDIEKMWNGGHIQKIEITVTEQLGIEGRAIFYDEVGALRDFIQSHMLQMLAITGMDLPDGSSSDAMHAARLNFLRGIEPIRPEAVNTQADRGQYDGYRAEVQNADSFTETFARIRLTSTAPRWQGTTMILQTGKAMSDKKAEIRLTFSMPNGEPAEVVFWIQPDDGIRVTSAPGNAAVAELERSIAAFNQAHPAAAWNTLGYERVLVDAIHGDHAIFTTKEEVIVAWEIVMNVIKTWSQNSEGLTMYPKGSATVD